MTTQTPPRPEWTAVIDAHRRNISYAVIGVGAALLIAAAVLAIMVWRSDWPVSALIVPFLMFGLTALGGGLWFQAGTGGELTGKDTARLLVLILGGALGLALAVGGIWQTILWWRYVVGGGKEGAEEEAAAEPWRLWVLVAVVLGGLAVMFFSLLLARGEESDSPTLRRLLYGYVAVLSGLLLLAVLVGLNILGYYYLPKSSDWTEAGIYTLSSKSEQVLKGLKQPVTVYVMEQQRGERFDVDMRDLIENARAVTDKISAQFVVRDINVNEMARLKERYKPDDDLGLIVVHGSGENESHTFIPMREVLAPPPFDPSGRSRQREPSFKGEDRLVSAISFLEEGKKKPVLYFTLGNGELDLFGLVPGSRPAQRGQALAERLERNNYEVKGLVLGGDAAAINDPRVVVSKGVPDDAAVVVVAGPTKPFQQETLDALRKYMSEPRKEKDPSDPSKQVERKGKLLVLSGAVGDRDDKAVPLGLERLLADYDVTFTNDRVLRADARLEHPEAVFVTPNPDLKGKNPLATLFEGMPIQVQNARVVRPGNPAPPPGGAPPRFQAVELLATIHPIFARGRGVIAASDMRPPADVVAEFVAKRPAGMKEVATLPVAVAVSEAGAPDPNDPHAFMGGGRTDGPPRLVVLGDSSFISNEVLAGRAGREEGSATASAYYDLFASAVAWLRERPSSMGIEPKDRGSYTMKQNANLTAMLLLPLGLMSLGIVGLGLGVWVVRRR
jgi:hypothetical protein